MLRFQIRFRATAPHRRHAIPLARQGCQGSRAPKHSTWSPIEKVPTSGCLTRIQNQTSLNHTCQRNMRKRQSVRPSKCSRTRLYLNCLYVSVRTINSSPRYLAQSGALHFRKAWASSGGRHVHCCANRANARSETVHVGQRNDETRLEAP